MTFITPYIKCVRTNFDNSFWLSIATPSGDRGIVVTWTWKLPVERSSLSQLSNFT